MTDQREDVENIIWEESKQNPQTSLALYQPRIPIFIPDSKKKLGKADDQRKSREWSSKSLSPPSSETTGKLSKKTPDKYQYLQKASIETQRKLQVAMWEPKHFQTVPRKLSLKKVNCQDEVLKMHHKHLSTPTKLLHFQSSDEDSSGKGQTIMNTNVYPQREGMIEKNKQTHEAKIEKVHQYQHKDTKTHQIHKLMPTKLPHSQQITKGPSTDVEVIVTNKIRLEKSDKNEEQIHVRQLEYEQPLPSTEHNPITTRRESIKIRKNSISYAVRRSRGSIKLLICLRCNNIINKSETENLLLILFTHSKIGKSSFKCEICLAWRSSKQNISEHLLHHVQNKQAYCIKCRNDINSLSIEPMYNMKNHVNFVDAFAHKRRVNVSPSRRMQWLSILPRCKKCGLIFDYTVSLMQKVIEMLPDRWATDKVVFKCHKCGIRTPFLKSIQEHVHSHISYGDILCRVCCNQ